MKTSEDNASGIIKTFAKLPDVQIKRFGQRHVFVVSYTCDKLKRAENETSLKIQKFVLYLPNCTSKLKDTTSLFGQILDLKEQNLLLECYTKGVPQLLRAISI